MAEDWRQEEEGRGETSTQLGRPFQIRESLRNCAYCLEQLDETIISKTWNSTHLKYYFIVINFALVKHPLVHLGPSAETLKHPSLRPHRAPLGPLNPKNGKCSSTQACAFVKYHSIHSNPSVETLKQ
ncbi:hypothetical protein CR513_60669, partial [Mucuna pruriens]